MQTTHVTGHHTIPLDENKCFEGRICELAASISSIAIAIIITIIAFCCANFVAAALITGATWFVVLGGNLLSCCSCIPNLCPRDAAPLGGRDISVTYPQPTSYSRRNMTSTGMTGAPITPAYIPSLGAGYTRAGIGSSSSVATGRPTSHHFAADDDSAITGASNYGTLLRRQGGRAVVGNSDNADT